MSAYVICSPQILMEKCVCSYMSVKDKTQDYYVGIHLIYTKYNKCVP